MASHESTGVNKLAKKLGLTHNSKICLLAAPIQTEALIREAGRDAMALIITELGQDRYDQILCWPRSLSGLIDQLQGLQYHIPPEGAIWVVMPKKKFARERGIDFSWEQMQAAVLKTDLVDNKVASITEQEYGTRFVIRKEKRSQDI